MVKNKQKISRVEVLGILGIGVTYIFFGIHEVGDANLRLFGGNIVL